MWFYNGIVTALNDAYRSEKLPPTVSVWAVVVCVRFCMASKPTGSEKQYWSDK